MKSIEILLSFISKYKFTLILIALFLSLEKVIVSLYKKVIVDTFLSKFTSSPINDILFALVIIFLIIGTLHKIHIRFYITINTIVYLIFIMLFYSYVRFIYSDNLLGLMDENRIKYFDLIYVLFLCTIITKSAFNRINKGLINQSEEKISFYDDTPELSSEKDVLNRKELALKVGRYIKSNPSLNPIAIGIVGKWGEGKSTFMSFIKESFIHDEKYLTVDFRGWTSISTKSIIEDFFTTIETKIKPHSIDVAKEIKKYGNSVLSVYKSSTTETLLNAINLISDNSLSDEFKKIEDLLIMLDRRVIVFFDDLDRLQPNEVFEVLKLIRNSASFKTFNYVVGYDKDYVKEALKANNIPNPEKYCEKIFINEFYLMPITKEQIIEYIEKQLKENFESDELADAFKMFKAYIVRGNIFASITTLRDAKRFLTEFSLSYESIKDDVFFKDFLILKLLKFSYYNIYYLLFSSKNKFIVNIDNSPNSISQISLKSIGNNNPNNYRNSELRKYLSKSNNFTEEQHEELDLLFDMLFKGAAPLSFTYNHNYEKYFNDELNESEISVKEFKKLISSEWEIILSFLQQWKKQGRLFGILSHVTHTKALNMENKKQYQNYIKMLFELQSIFTKDDSLRSVSIDYFYIESSILDSDFEISKKFYNKDRNLLKQFILNLLYEAKYPFTYEMGLCQYLYKMILMEDNKLLTKRELEEYLILCFRSIIEENNFSEYDFFDTFFQTELVKISKVSDQNDTFQEDTFILPEVKELSKTVLLKYPNEFLVEMISIDRKSIKKDNVIVKFKVSEFVLNIFTSYNEFINYVEQNISGDFKSEFLDFAKKMLNSGDYIEYDFTYEPVNVMIKDFINSKLV